MRELVIVVPALVIAACTTELTEDAMKVRRIPAAIESGCQFLGPVSGSESFGMTIAEDAESSLNQVRNKVAELGGNAFVLTGSNSSYYDGSFVQADAYRCP